MKRDEVRANRQKWIDYLKEPGRAKTKWILESYYYPEARCCLGHACYILGIPREIIHQQVIYDGVSSCAPQSLIKLTGLSNHLGSIIDGRSSLVSMNDKSDMSPQEIGEYLEKHIEGGGPFLPLTDYPE